MILLTLGALWLLNICEGGKLELPEGLILEWSFPSDTTVSFSYSVPDSITSTYGWVGLGFKYITEDQSMKDADIVNIIFGSLGVDSVGEGNQRPVADVDAGGTEDIQAAFIESTVEGYTVYTWERVLDTADTLDKVFVIGDEYKALYAFGDVNDEGSQMQHLSGNKGIVNFVLEGDQETTSFLNFF